MELKNGIKEWIELNSPYECIHLWLRKYDFRKLKTK